MFILLCNFPEFDELWLSGSHYALFISLNIIYQARMRNNGLLTTALKQELSLLQSISLSGAPENLQTIKQSLIDSLQTQISWQQDIEDALEKCGVNIKVSTEGRYLNCAHVRTSLKDLKVGQNFFAFYSIRHFL